MLVKNPPNTSGVFQFREMKELFYDPRAKVGVFTIKGIPLSFGTQLKKGMSIQLLEPVFKGSQSNIAAVEGKVITLKNLDKKIPSIKGGMIIHLVGDKKKNEEETQVIKSGKGGKITVREDLTVQKVTAFTIFSVTLTGKVHRNFQKIISFPQKTFGVTLKSGLKISLTGDPPNLAPQFIDKVLTQKVVILKSSIESEAPLFKSVTFEGDLIVEGDLISAWYQYQDPLDQELRPELSWEYWNGTGWVSLKIDDDNTKRLLVGGTISFGVPSDLEKTEVSGQENYWIRARIVGGDYGKESFIVRNTPLENPVGAFEQKIIPDKSPIQPPFVKSLALSYKLTKHRFLNTCLTYNNLEFRDQTAACKTPGKYFQPFRKLEDVQKTIYLGFNHSFSGGPVKSLFQTQEIAFEDQSKPKTRLGYEFRQRLETGGGARRNRRAD